MLKLANQNTWGMSAHIDIYSCDNSLITDEKYIKQFGIDLCEKLKVIPYKEPLIVNFGANEDVAGFSYVQLIDTSILSAHFSEKYLSAYFDLFSCKLFNIYEVAVFVNEYFKGDKNAIKIQGLNRTKKGEYYCNENEVAIVKNTDFGKGLFAKKDISKDEEIAMFDGEIYFSSKASDLPNEPPFKIRDRAIQISEFAWQDSNSLARFANHSCNPNCGIKGNTILVAMEQIKKGQEITFDYEMTEDSDWFMECSCGESRCRKQIRGFKYMPKNIRSEYGNYIASWLLKKYKNEL